MKLNQEAIDNARNCNLKEGAVTASVEPYAKEICTLLNQALATEWVCVLRYRRHYFTAKGITSEAIVDEIMVHAEEEMAQADRLAEGIGPFRALSRTHWPIRRLARIHPRQTHRVKPRRLRRLHRFTSHD